MYLYFVNEALQRYLDLGCSSKYYCCTIFYLFSLSVWISVFSWISCIDRYPSFLLASIHSMIRAELLYIWNTPRTFCLINFLKVTVSVIFSLLRFKLNILIKFRITMYFQKETNKTTSIILLANLTLPWYYNY